MSLEFILLGLLRDPGSGYDLRREFEEGPRHFWSARLNQIYPTLQRMEDRGWLTSSTQRSDKGPARRVYRRTRAGTTTLRAWLRGEPDVGVERLSYIGQLVFLGELRDRDRSCAFLCDLRHCFAEKQDFLKACADALQKDNPGAPSDWDEDVLHELLCVEIGIGALAGKIAACDRCLDLLATKPPGRTKGHSRG